MKLIKYNQACTAIAAAKKVDEVKSIMDEHERMQIYARQSKNHELEMDAAEIRIRATRRLGQLIQAQKETVGLRGPQHSKGGGSKGSKREPLPDAPPTLAAAGIDKKLSSLAQKYASAPEKQFKQLMDKWRWRIANENGRVTVNLLKANTKIRRKAEKSARKKAPLNPDIVGMFDIAAGDVKNIDCGLVDCIITDPPYPEKFLPVYSDLAETAARLLKDGGSCVVLVGQSYLPEIIERLSKHLTYQWTLAYLTPGGQSSQLWDRKVNTFWKPLLWFTKGKYSGDWIGDVCRSQTNDNDKRFHHWGQSESGMADIVMRFTNAGDTVLDPFCGGGTTGVVALELGRKFIGRDSDAEAVKITLARIGKICNAK